ncbi:MATE family efflux transporter [Litoreibacter roseus]|uniref:MATE family efflux transporter n=1 Tax=Litoreibacter roseus TaxID=2601869 RepID=A0A6N6JIL1_9RHOB|nr:MATE family efflux transporter [Litoreibacter roseus]GFE66106.1 MATE family efflux transporter [Litoreibacter roseus]
MANRKLTEGPVWKALAQISAPMSFGIFAVLSVGIADAYFLGQLGQNPLAAVGYIYPVTTSITSLAIGLSAGANTVVSQSLGREDEDSVACRLALHAFGLGLCLAIIAAIAFWLAHPWIFGLIGASDEVMTEVSAYTNWWALSFPFLVMMMITNSIFRAHGDGTTSAAIMIFSAVINVLITPLLVFGWGPIPGFETAGAAMATFIAQLTACVAAVTYAVRRGMLALGDTPLKGIRDSVKDIANVGAPAALSNAINPAGMAAVTAAVATLGDTAVAGFGAATRVQSLAIVVMLALSSGIGPVVGQNWGAKREDRARLAVRAAWTFCLGYGAALAVLLTIFAGPIAQMIASDEGAAEYTALYLRVVGCSLFGYGILVTANAAMNARSKAGWSMGLSLSRIFLVYLPGAWIGVTLLGYIGILVAAVAANVFAVLGAIYTGRKTKLVSAEDGWATGFKPLKTSSA